MPPSADPANPARVSCVFPAESPRILATGELPPESLMRLQYLVTVLVAWVCLAPTPGVDRSARMPARSTTGRASLESVPASVSSPRSSTTTSFSRPLLWRHRIKSVLEGKDARGFEPVDLGPAVVPDRLDGLLRSAPGIHCSRPSIPLRC